jgi:hypothetical protein
MVKEWVIRIGLGLSSAALLVSEASAPADSWDAVRLGAKAAGVFLAGVLSPSLVGMARPEPPEGKP